MGGIVLSISGGIALAYLLGFCWGGASVPKTIFKTASVLGLSLAAAVGGGPWLLVAALALSAIGDFELSLAENKGLIPGMGAFGAAHSAYIVLFLTLPHAPVGWLSADPVAWLYLLLGLSVPLWLLPRAGALKWPVAGYVALIVAMGLASRLHGGQIAIGAGLFILSDLVLSLELFILSTLRGAFRALPFVIWTAYWGGQAVILTGLVDFFAPR